MPSAKPEKEIKGIDLVAPSTDAARPKEEHGPIECALTRKPIVPPVDLKHLQDRVDQAAEEPPNKTIRRLRDSMHQTIN